MNDRCACGREDPDSWHLILCDEGGHDTSGVCPMCGEEYDRFLGHLEHCDGPRD
jgi:hypothetical protein